jgi:hypothetical protein
MNRAPSLPHHLGHSDSPHHEPEQILLLQYSSSLHIYSRVKPEPDADSPYISRCHAHFQGMTAKLLTAAMTAKSQALIKHDPLHYLPPGVWRMVALRTSVAAADREMHRAQLPREVHDVIMDLRVLLHEVSACGAGPWVAAVYQLLRQAKSIIRQMCAAAVDRCAKLLAACDRHFFTRPAPPMPSYESMAQAVRAADDTWRFQPPPMRHFYKNIIRTRMMVFMADSDPDDDSSDLEERASEGRSPKRAILRPIAAAAKLRCTRGVEDAHQDLTRPGAENCRPGRQ